MKALSLCGFVIGLSSFATAAPINQVPYGSLTGTQLITFEDITGGIPPGTNYDAIFESGFAAFAERFTGQTLSVVGEADILAGSPSGPLTLQAGNHGENTNILNPGTGNVFAGLGPARFPSFQAIGEGSIAVLFDFGQSEIGFEISGGDNGSAVLDFFRADGSLIQTLTLTGITDGFYAFAREGGVKDIVGFSIHNTDFGGLAYDNFKHDVAGVPDTTSMPEPASALLMASGLGALAALYRRRK